MAAEDGRSGKAGGATSDAELARRLDRLSRDLDAGRPVQAAAGEAPRANGQGIALGLRMASEFVAGVLVGALLGWALDRVAGTSPWGLIGLLLLGFAAGVVNVVRVAGRTTATGDGDGGEGSGR